MALVPKIRNRTISDKPVSSSCTRTSSFRQRLLASCKRFLRFKLLVRASSVSLKKKAARCSQSQQVVKHNDDRIEEHSSSNRGFKDGNNFLVSSTETKKLVAVLILINILYQCLWMQCKIVLFHWFSKRALVLISVEVLWWTFPTTQRGGSSSSQ